MTSRRLPDPAASLCGDRPMLRLVVLLVYMFFSSILCTAIRTSALPTNEIIAHDYTRIVCFDPRKPSHQIRNLLLDANSEPPLARTSHP
jgi:hypothetical protein